MTLSRDELARLERLRELFLAEPDGRSALADYWRDERDLAAYDRVLGARIGWKWDAVLLECRDRGFGRADGEVLLDYGCGSGIAARRFVAAFGAREVLCHDRSPRAMAYASARLAAEHRGVATRSLADLGDLRPDVLLVSHVLGELDEAGVDRLAALVRRSRRALLVEPGNRAISRRLVALRERLRGDVLVLAPCPHQAVCPVAARRDDWCHFFAPPPPEVFTDGDWVRAARAVGIDSRALPYAFLAVQAAAVGEVQASPPDRLLGRPQVLPHSARVQVCEASGLRDVDLPKRADKELWRRLKKEPETVRHLPPA